MEHLRSILIKIAKNIAYMLQNITKHLKDKKCELREHLECFDGEKGMKCCWL